MSLRDWQRRALSAWDTNGRRGIVSAVTGGGKTVLALACIAHSRPETALIVVPSAALQDQWWEESAAFLNLPLNEVNLVKRHIEIGTVNIAVLNTAAKISYPRSIRNATLVVDECHKAAAPEFRRALEFPAAARLGLSATPERPYDDGLEGVLVPSLGDVIFSYTYADALKEGVIVPFALRNVVFDFEPEIQRQYDMLTRRIARSSEELGMDAPETIQLCLRRSRVSYMSVARLRVALRLVAAHHAEQILVFHESTGACDAMAEVMRENGVSAGVYHSKLPMGDRVRTIQAFRSKDIRVLVTCRALDEGFNVPETEVGIIAAAAATERQRIQRLGRVLRPSPGKERAIVYTLVASGPEIERLRSEEGTLSGIADVAWSRA